MRWRTSSFAATVLVGWTVLATSVWPPAAAAAPAAGCARPSGVFGDGVPWPQQLLNAGNVWPLTTGTGVLVAVLGTGVDAANAQFTAGQIGTGADVTPAATTARSDCDGRGTFAAGVIGAKRDRRTTFAGVAPGARILPIRYVQAVRGGADTVDPGLVAKAITAAVDAHASVICVVVPATSDSPQLRAAVAAARQADALIVSPAVASAASGGGATTSYPTADDGVLAVGAIDQAGAAVSTEAGDYLAIAAPGKGLVGTAAGSGGSVGHVWPVDDTRYAAAYVAGAAALVRAYRPDLSAAQVTNRLERTASRPATSGHDPRLGWGVVNAYAAVATEGVDARAAGRPPPPSQVAAARPESSGTGLDRPIAAIAAVGVALAGLLALGAAAVKRGRARGWRSG
jgi:membrane-anchored mycosin MYCP